MPTPARSTTEELTDGAAALGDPDLRRFLLEYVKKRVPRAEVDDVVQTVLLDALASTRRPEEREELRKWVVGIARHKCADLHRRSGRERPADDELPEQPAAPSPIEERALVRWAEEQAQSSHEAGKTLDWMAREGEGDKLEHIAEEEQLPPARVRQRVSRMRRFLKERWLAEVALVAALGALALLAWRWLRKDDEPIVADPTRPPEGPTEPERERVAEGRRLRDRALETCREGDARRCVQGLDQAKELDPAGDGDPAVRQARDEAAASLREEEERRRRDEDARKVTPPSPSDTVNLDADMKSSPQPTKAAPRNTATPKAPPAPPKPSPKSKSFPSDDGSTGLDDAKAPPSKKEAAKAKPQAPTSTPPSSDPPAPPALGKK